MFSFSGHNCRNGPATLSTPDDIVRSDGEICLRCHLLSQTRQAMPTRSTDPADYQDVPRPVAVMAKNVEDNHTTGWHRHKRGQLVFASSGVMVVKTHEGTWVIPPQRAV